MKDGSTRRSAALAAVKRVWADRRGATAIEYALVAVGIALTIIVAVFALGNSVDDLFFNQVSTQLQNSVSN